MDLAAIQKQITQNREAMGQRYAPEARLANENRIRETIFGNDAQLNSLRDNEAAKVRELYEFDKGLVSASKQHGEPAGFVDDPSSALRYTAEKSQARAGELADIQKGVANRQDVLGNALENALKAINYGLEMEALKTKGLEDDFERGVTMEKLAMEREAKRKEGSVTDKRTQEATAQMLAEMKEDVAASIAEAKETKTPINQKELIWKWIKGNEPFFKSSGVDAAALWDVYNSTPGNSALEVEPSPTENTFLQSILPFMQNKPLDKGGVSLWSMMGNAIPKPKIQKNYQQPKFVNK